MAKCQVIGLDCPTEDLCEHCHGTGSEPDEELCQSCDICFDEVCGWSLGIKPGSKTALGVQAMILRDHEEQENCKCP